ncbi:MAG TPA: sulfatase-like hydrolase/transferase, partial [Nannocystaceae bacterium]|nr:sulfatase-like hydrolase/transferase [Nannocystaceae bacterium]
ELVWIVTADHGEALLAGDRMHGFDLSEPVVHVPLVIGGPGITAGRVAAPVSTLDLFPTILALTNTPPVPWTDGVDLLADRELDPQRVVLVDTWHRGGAGQLLFDQVAATDGAHELVFEITKNAWGLVDLRDPARAPQDVLASFDPEPWRAKIRAYLEAGPLELLP